MATFKHKREMYIPKEYSNKITSKDIPGLEVYLYEKPTMGKNYPCAVGFSGKAQKPAFRYRYFSEKSRADSVERFINNTKSSLDAKNERAAKKKAFVHSLKTGDILYSSWGYDQTNIDFYKVSEVVGKKTVKIVPISSALDRHDGCQSNLVLANPENETGKPMLKRVSEGNIISLNSYSSAYLWDGRPLRETDAYSGH